jgi:hypothetical protein
MSALSCPTQHPIKVRGATPLSRLTLGTIAYKSGFLQLMIG